MSLSRFYSGTPLDFDLFDGFPGIRGRHPLVPFEETRTSRMMQPRYVFGSRTDLPVRPSVADTYGTGWTSTRTRRGTS